MFSYLFFFFCFSYLWKIWKIVLTYDLFSSSWILSLVVLSLLKSPSFLLLLFKFFLVFPFNSILRSPISLLTLSMCFCMLSIFSIRALNILIILILNPLFDNSNMCVISEFGSTASFVSKFCWFLACFVIFWLKVSFFWATRLYVNRHLE